MRKVATLAVLVAMGLGTLAGCGGKAEDQTAAQPGGSAKKKSSDTKAYCAEVKKQNDAKTDPADTAAVLTVFKKIRDVAPDEIKGDWTAVVDVTEKSAGKKQPTADETAKFTTALETIQKQVKDKCGFDMT